MGDDVHSRGHLACADGQRGRHAGHASRGVADGNTELLARVRCGGHWSGVARGRGSGDVSAVFLPLISEWRGAGRGDAEGGGLARGPGLIDGLRDAVRGAGPSNRTRVGVATTTSEPERNKKACKWKL